MSQNIQQVTPFEGPDQITIGNGQGLNINSLGVSTFASPLNPKVSFLLSNLLFVPSITKFLISVSKFCKDSNVNPSSHELAFGVELGPNLNSKMVSKPILDSLNGPPTVLSTHQACKY